MVAGRPIVLQSKDGHALWVSKKVLQAMGSIPDEVEGGIIIRDSSGKPTGERSKSTSSKVVLTQSQVYSLITHRNL